MMLLTASLSASLSTPLSAAPYTPKSNDDIIAQWAAPSNAAMQSLKTASRLQPNDPATILALANSYLAQAAQPGQSRFYGLAQAALKPLIEKTISDKTISDKNSTSPQLWLAWAQVQQHQHNFTTAQAALEKVLAADPSNETANLLAARIFIIQEKPLAARNACLKLLGNADLLTITACSLEANSYLNPNDLNNSYQQLAELVKRQGLPDDERAIWLIQLLADFAMRNNDPATAATWLQQRLPNASVNYLVQWADVQLALNNSQAVITQLAPIVNAAPEMDDALLVRLALSEKHIRKEHGEKDKHWQTLLAERVTLREQRQDSLHASELAIYYLDITPNPEKALHWAEINFSNTREYSDKKLLIRAQQLNSAKNNQGGIQ
jgi:tetratricopeptide (TPR) repeat protein